MSVINTNFPKLTKQNTPGADFLDVQMMAGIRLFSAWSMSLYTSPYLFSFFLNYNYPLRFLSITQQRNTYCLNFFFTEDNLNTEWKVALVELKEMIVVSLMMLNVRFQNFQTNYLIGIH